MAINKKLKRKPGPFIQNQQKKEEKVEEPESEDEVCIVFEVIDENLYMITFLYRLL